MFDVVPPEAVANDPTLVVDALGPAAVDIVVAPKFCNMCGAAWQAGASHCAGCVSRVVQSPTSRQPATVFQAITLYFCLLGVSIAGLLAALCGANEFWLTIAWMAAHSLIVVAYCLRNRKMVIDALLCPVPLSWFPKAIGLAVLTYTFATIVLAAGHRFTGVQAINESEPFIQYGLLFTILMVCGQPAIFEELGFRGIVLPTLQPTLAPREAILVSALLFMTLHLTFFSFPHLFAIGIALGYLRVRTGSMLPGMVLHFTHNLLCVLGEQYFSRLFHGFN